MKSFLRSFLPLLLGLLASCSVYDNIVHPRRLPTPNMTAEAKAKYRAAEKARHKGQVLKTEEITTNATDPNAAGASKDKADNKLTYNELPEGTRVKYDKQLLLKNKPKLKRRQYHHYDTGPLPHREASRENRRLRKHSKGKDHPRDAKEAKEDKTPLAPPTDANPVDEPTPPPPTKAPKEVKVKEARVKEPKVKEEKAPKVKEEKAPKVKKDKKVPIPKPYPTQERPGY